MSASVRMAVGPGGEGLAEKAREVARALGVELTAGAGAARAARRLPHHVAAHRSQPSAPRVPGAPPPPQSTTAAPPPLVLGDVALADDAPVWRLEAALLHALAPRHVLFLCVANSARSQMAHGIARALAPEGVRISSAGSEPTRVRPQAIAALAEIGIDISHHTSKGVDEVERPVHAVVTLCAEEVCPVWLERAWRLHWGLPDPAGAGATPEEEMQAFRSVRDELMLRLRLLFGAPE